MRTFSSRLHPPLTHSRHGEEVLLDDPAIPAVSHLTGPAARGAVAAAVEAAGGTLHGVRVRQVQYRPGTHVVARYRADVTWADGVRRTDETLLAAASVHGPLPGTVRVAADQDGETVEASVWRWPFDPVVLGLEAAVTPGGCDALVSDWTGPAPQAEVVAYRPTERAVVRLTGIDGRCVYVKAIPPGATAPLHHRHGALRDAGLPVPEVLATDEARGLVVLAELPGPTYRERIKGDLRGWPDVAAIDELLEQLRRVPSPGPAGRGGRVADGRHHALVLSALLPDLRPALDVLADRFAAEAGVVLARAGTTVHGDLHEGQLVVDDDGRITGLLDVDDVGAGDPIDDHVTLAAHLRFRARTLERRAGDVASRLETAARHLEQRAADRFGAEATGVALAAVLVGLATGPFRMQRPCWRDEVTSTVADAVRVSGCGDMRDFSDQPHEHLTAGLHRGTRSHPPHTRR